MRFFMALACTCVLLSGCGRNHVPTASRQPSADLSCLDMVNNASDIFTDVSESTKKPTCVQYTDDLGNKVKALYGGGLYKRSYADTRDDQTHGFDINFNPRAFTRIERYDSLVAMPETAAPKLDDMLKVVRLEGPVEVRLRSASASGTVYRMTIAYTDITIACIQADTRSTAGAPMRLLVCRSVTRTASDAEVMLKARQIAFDDFSAVRL